MTRAPELLTCARERAGQGALTQAGKQYSCAMTPREGGHG
jgi:hypothetical protein